ncbi:MAG: hypothetical protein QXZ13_01810 [Candidatus Diapherotrites archaeon]
MNYLPFQKGFTLFTALVAFVLIILAMLLVQSMASTQRSASDIISDISEQEEMQTLADLTRADALQTVNYGIRQEIENYLTKDSSPQDGLPDNTEFLFYSTAIDSDNWNKIKLDFIKSQFGIGETIDEFGRVVQKNQFAARVANEMENRLATTADTGGYTINIARPEGETLKVLLDDALEENFKKNQEDVFEVIDCENTFGSRYKNCNGSFYVTLDLSPEIVDNSNYEKFPQVEVRKIIGFGSSVRIIKEPVLPRGKIKMYIPIRIFKAFAGALEIGLGSIFREDFYNELPKDFKTTEEVKSKVEPIVKRYLDDFIATNGFDLEYDGFKYKEYKIRIEASVDNKGTADPDDDTAELSVIVVSIYFEDKNDKYKVNKNSPNVYGIKLVRTFN